MQQLNIKCISSFSNLCALLVALLDEGEVKLKVKVTLKQAMKAQSGSRSIAVLFFNLGARLGWVVNATRRPLYPRE